MKKVVFLLIMTALICALSAQSNSFAPSIFNHNSSIGLLNPYKLHMSHSMGFSAGTSSNGLGFYQSRYTNHINYEFNPKLNLALDLNFVNMGTTMSKDTFEVKANNDNKSRIFPEFSLTYKPSENTTISFEYRNINPYDQRLMFPHYWQEP